MENRREFFNQIAQEFKIKESNEWSKISEDDICKRGGKSLLKLYNGSLKNALESIYADLAIPFQITPRSVLTVNEKRRKFFDELAKKLNIQNPPDWGKITRNQVLEERGGSFLSNYYNNSIYRALKQLYPEVQWKPDWFRKSGSESARIDLETSTHSSGTTDGVKITNKITRNLDENSKLLTNSSKMQGLLFHYLKQWFPNTEILFNFKHPGMFHYPREGLSFNTELDIWIPSFKLAFEFNGEQHYKVTALNSNLVDQRRRDEEKRKQCKEVGITLIEVPYWWDGTEGKSRFHHLRKAESIIRTLTQHRPDLTRQLQGISVSTDLQI